MFRMQCVEDTESPIRLNLMHNDIQCKKDINKYNSKHTQLWVYKLPYILATKILVGVLFGDLITIKHVQNKAKLWDYTGNF